MRNTVFNFTLFSICSAVLIGFWWYAEKNWMPKREPRPAAAETAPGTGLAAVAGGVADVARPPVAPKVEAKAPARPTPAAPVEPPTLIALGGEGFFNRVLLSTRGGGVQQVVLPEFNEATRLGTEALKDGKPLPLFLVPGTLSPRPFYMRDPVPTPDLRPGKVAATDNLAEPSYAIFHYASTSADDRYPLPDLGERTWEVVAEDRPAEGAHAVAFETKLGDPYFLVIRKTYTLSRKDYHVGLKLEVRREAVEGAAKGKGVFRYQMSGPRGLPIEGVWYTSTFRNALVGWTDPGGTPRRSFEDSATVAAARGGEKLERGGNAFQYAAVATQYFASAVAVDDAAEGAARNPWSYVRATSEAPSAEDLKRATEAAVLNPDDRSASDRLNLLKAQTDAKQPQFDDITVRAVSEPIDLAPGQSVTHSYLLYNGPAKVELLKLLAGPKAVDEALVERYLRSLGLRTIADYQSPTAMGRFANAIYWTDLVVFFTNVMHWILAGIHWVLNGMGLGPVAWGLSIVGLTVMVRLLLFFPSRKQTQMNMRMIEIQTRLKPELDKLHAKYGDDFQTYNREKTALMMRHGLNPLAPMGGCLMMFAQMPIMMGLYFCLQESIFFRLEPFLWVANLAAPDMTVWWTEQIPVISSPDSLGGFLYMGPYLNVLPILSVGLMMWQQGKMLPPPTDDMARQQRMMMKLMLGMMAVMFYKVASGLTLYFIVTTVWGMIERRLVPKPTPAGGGPMPGAGGSGDDGGPDDGPPAPRGPFGRMRARMHDKLQELQKQAEAQSSRQHRNDRDPRRLGRLDDDRSRRDLDRKKKRRK